MRVTPREVITVVERVLVRCGYDRGVAEVAAEYLAAGELDGGEYLALLVAVLPQLSLGSPSAVLRLVDGRIEAVDADNAFSLVVAASVLDLLDSACRSGLSDHCTVNNTRFPEFLGTIRSVARERGLEVDVSPGPDSATCRIIGTCSPDPGTVAFASDLDVPERGQALLVRHANEILAPASQYSRGDAGY